MNFIESGCWVRDPPSESTIRRVSKQQPSNGVHWNPRGWTDCQKIIGCVLFSGHLFSHLVVHMPSRTKGGLDPFLMGGVSPSFHRFFGLQENSWDQKTYAFVFAKVHVSEAKTLHQWPRNGWEMVFQGACPLPDSPCLVLWTKNVWRDIVDTCFHASPFVCTIWPNRWVFL